MRKPSRVIWTDREKAEMVSAVAELRTERADLSGLPLLREAMTSLPINRRRKLIAVTQAPWFERDLELERRRLEAKRLPTVNAVQVVTHEADPYAPLLRAILAELRAMSGKLDALIARETEHST